MRIRPLLNRRPLEPGESLSSLWARLQVANYYRSPNAIADICQPHLPSPENENFNLPHLAETWPVLAAVTRLPATDLYNASFHRYAAVLALPWETLRFISLPDGEHVSLVSTRMRQLFLRPLKDAQYCPACLANGCYHRLNWANLLVAICPHHECLLQQGCPNCRQKLSVPAIVAGKCPTCKHDLMATSTISVKSDNWGLWTQLYLQSWWEDVPVPPFPDQITVPDQPNMILLEVLRGLATAVTKLPEEALHPNPYPGSLASTSKVPVPVHVYRIYATAMKAIAYWPQSFHQFLDLYRQRPGVKVGRITDEFYPLYLAWLEEQWQQPAFAFIQEAFDDFLVANYILSRSLTSGDRYRRSQEFRDRFAYLTQVEASERLGVEIEVVQRLVDAEMLVDYERGEGIQRHWHERLRIVRRTEFVDLQRRWQAGVPLIDVAQIFGVDKQVVKNLVNATLLTRCDHLSDLGNNLWWIEKTSLNAFIRGVNPYPVIPHNFEDPITLRELTESGYDPVRVLQQAMAGEARTIWLSGGLYSLWVNQDDMHLLENENHTR